jgi:hypothetical protein
MSEPFTPRPIEEHQARLPVALARLFHAEDAERGGDRPGLHPECYFDFEEGVRLLVSREDWFGRRVIHASASVRPDSMVTLIYQGSTIAVRLDAIKRLLATIGLEGMTLVGINSDGVPHWIKDTES